LHSCDELEVYVGGRLEAIFHTVGRTSLAVFAKLLSEPYARDVSLLDAKASRQASDVRKASPLCRFHNEIYLPVPESPYPVPRRRPAFLT
jgi:hypothetical protein